MELSIPFSGFFDAIANDARIGTTHISLYMALLKQWSLNIGNNSFSVERDNVMKAAKINSRQTYNRCMSNLHEFGYISYKPAINGARRSKVSLKYCDKEQ